MFARKHILLAFPIWVAVCFLTPAVVAGQGTNSADFLQIPVFSRGSALSGAMVANADGVGALFYNPAGVARNGSGEVSFSHTELMQDLRLDNVSVAIPLKNGSGIGLGVTYLGYGSIAGYDAAGASTGSLSAYSFMMNVGYSQKLSEALSAGIAMKPVFERLDDLEAQTVTFDLGLIADVGQFSFGAQYANIGGKLKYVQEEVGLPTTMRFGMSYRTLGSSSVISFAGNKEQGEGISFGAGMEYAYNSMLTFRAGYGGSLEDKTNSTDGVALGIGLNLNHIGLDYSYRPSSTNEGIHQITGSYQFGR
ncbi:MAG: PorV/PorQ family protein [Candidatus Zixiibacteriota bacterium]